MKGLGCFVVMVDVGVDGIDEFHHIAKHATPKAVDRKVSKEALHHVEPRSTGGREMDVEPWMALEPRWTAGCL